MMQGPRSNMQLSKGPCHYLYCNFALNEGFQYKGPWSMQIEMLWFETIPVCIFPLLETFPNLASLVFFDLSTRVRLQDVHLFAKIAQQTALSHLYFSLEGGLIADGPPISGPERLKSLSVEWNVSDGSEPGSSQSHLHEFLRPSLGTLTWLQLDGCPTIDFQALGPACTLLRTL